MKRFVFLIFLGTLFASISSVFGAGQKADYVPVPQPARSDYEIAAFYYPGTEQMAEWNMIEQTCPKIKPLLGWYNEGNPEVIDWQIKWAVENGISVFFTNWYPNRLQHWIEGFYKSRYKSYLKWAIMGGCGSDTASIRQRMKIYIDRYFHTPEYYKIDGKPVLMFWDTESMDEGFIREAAKKGEKLQKGEGMKRAVDLMNEIARDAGFPGMYCFARYFHPPYPDPGKPNIYVDKSKEQLKMIEKAGFDATFLYNYTDAFWRTKNRRSSESKMNYPFKYIVKENPKIWREYLNYTKLPFFPIISAGWDDTPRSFEKAKVITGRNPKDFKTICEEAKKFCDENG
ncbi:MAG: glycoside hydrolase family 99-like domain-containing protein, partial [Planctomycetia bacterium]|nr:glycoside hydrolase family 99-like domain-containing protein [Planctomycetia bacterium]